MAQPYCRFTCHRFALRRNNPGCVCAAHGTAGAQWQPYVVFPGEYVAAQSGYAPPANHSVQAKRQLPVDWEDTAHQRLRQQSAISSSPQARQ
jgi:hypothetical protein